MELIDNLKPLSENLFWVQAPGKGKFPLCNGFLITGNETILVDAGMGSDVIKEIDKWRRIDCLLVSHSHPDHILFWHLLNDRKILMPRETPDSITDLMDLGIRLTGTPEKAIHWKKRTGDELGLHAMRLPDGRFQNGDIIDAEEIRLEAIHAPGHLNDHYCFLVHDSGIMLTTDIDFGSFGPWYGNPESDLDLFKNSIRMIQERSLSMVCSSHKSPIAKAEVQNAFDRYLSIFDRHKKLVFDLCIKVLSLEEMVCSSPFYRNRMQNKAVQNIFEEAMIQKNLDLLIKEGAIRKEGDKYIQSGY